MGGLQATLIVSILLFVGFCSKGLGHDADPTHPLPNPRTTETPTPVDRQGTPKVVPGVGIDQVVLGDGPDVALKRLGKPVEDYSRTVPLNPYIHWLAPSGSIDRDIKVYLRNDKIYQIEVGGPGYSTINGIRYLMPLNELKGKLDSSFETYLLTGSADLLQTGKDTVYIVSRSRGLAFEIQYFKNDEAFRVQKIIVFERSGKLVPNGYMPEWQELKKINIDKVK